MKHFVYAYFAFCNRGYAEFAFVPLSDYLTDPLKSLLFQRADLGNRLIRSWWIMNSYGTSPILHSIGSPILMVKSFKLWIFTGFWYLLVYFFPRKFFISSHSLWLQFGQMSPLRGEEKKTARRIFSPKNKIRLHHAGPKQNWYYTSLGRPSLFAALYMARSSKAGLNNWCVKSILRQKCVAGEQSARVYVFWVEKWVQSNNVSTPLSVIFITKLNLWR